MKAAVCWFKTHHPVNGYTWKSNGFKTSLWMIKEQVVIHESIHTGIHEACDGNWSGTPGVPLFFFNSVIKWNNLFELIKKELCLFDDLELRY